MNSLEQSSFYIPFNMNTTAPDLEAVIERLSQLRVSKKAQPEGGVGPVAQQIQSGNEEDDQPIDPNESYQDLSVFYPWVKGHSFPIDYEQYNDDQPFDLSQGYLFSCDMRPSIPPKLPDIRVLLQSLGMACRIFNKTLLVQGPAECSELAELYIFGARVGMPLPELVERASMLGWSLGDPFVETMTLMADFMESAHGVLGLQHCRLIVRNHFSSQDGRLTAIVGKATRTAVMVEEDYIRITGLITEDVHLAQAAIHYLLNGDRRAYTFQKLKEVAMRNCNERGDWRNARWLEGARFQE